MSDTGNWNGQAADHIDIEIDIEAVAAALLANDVFIRKLAIAVRNMLLKNARPYMNIFGKYAGGSQSR
jgi:hypothetical protein